jgi:chromosome segregation ATPase
MKDDLERDSRDKKFRIDELGRELSRTENEKRRCEFEIQKVTSNIGECKGLQTKYERDKRELKAILASAAKSLEWNSDTTFDSESEVADAVENICETVFVNETKLKNVIEEFEMKIEAEASKIGKLEIQQAQLEEQKKLKTNERIKIKRDLASLKRELTETDHSKYEQFYTYENRPLNDLIVSNL